MINNKACEISIELDNPIQIAREGGMGNASTILFRKPNRQTGPFFQNLVSMFNMSLQRQMAQMKSVASEEELDEAQKIANAKQAEIDAKEIMQSIMDVTFEQIMKEVEDMQAMITSTDFDFVKGFKLFDKILLGADKRYTVCEIDGKPITDGILDRIDYQDLLKMLLVYICFFGKPAKTGTMSDSDKQPESHTPVKEV